MSSATEVEWLRRISAQLTSMMNMYVPPVPTPRPGRMTHISVSIGPVTTQGETDKMQIHDNEQFDVTVAGEDSKGQATADTFTATSSDLTVVTVSDPDVDGKTFTLTAGSPGSAVVTLSGPAGTDGSVISVTEAVDVIVGSLATIAITEGPVSVQGATPPPPPPANPVGQTL